MGLLDTLSSGEEESTEQIEDTESGGRSLVRLLAGFGAVIIGIVTFRKLRNRRQRD